MSYPNTLIDHFIRIHVQCVSALLVFVHDVFHASVSFLLTTGTRLKAFWMHYETQISDTLERGSAHGSVDKMRWKRKLVREIWSEGNSSLRLLRCNSIVENFTYNTQLCNRKVDPIEVSPTISISESIRLYGTETPVRLPFPSASRRSVITQYPLSLVIMPYSLKIESPMWRNELASQFTQLPQERVSFEQQPFWYRRKLLKFDLV